MKTEEDKIIDYFIRNESKYHYEPDTSEKVPYTVVIVSRNRSPFDIDQYYLNPLIWAVDSVLEQKMLPDELIIVNDCSDLPPTDFTDEMAKKIDKDCEMKGVHFIYEKNKTRKNAAISRNIAAKIARNELLYFMDDDAVLKSESSYGAYLFDALNKIDDNFFILNLPLTTRVSHPAFLVPSDTIGKIDKENLKITSNLITRYPEEYVGNPPKENLGGKDYFKPLMLQNFQAGSVMVKKDKLLKVGGFPDYNSPIAYGEETGLAVRAVKNNYNIYYFPYLNLCGIHFSYGNSSGRQEFKGLDWLNKEREDKDLNLTEMVKESIKSRIHSGMRVQREVYFYVKIRNFALLLEELEKDLGFEEWAKKSYKDFVELNDELFMDGKGLINDKKTRKIIWDLAIEHAKENKCFSEEELLEALK